MPPPSAAPRTAIVTMPWCHSGPCTTCVALVSLTSPSAVVPSRGRVASASLLHSPQQWQPARAPQGCRACPVRSADTDQDEAASFCRFCCCLTQTCRRLRRIGRKPPVRSPACCSSPRSCGSSICTDAHGRAQRGVWAGHTAGPSGRRGTVPSEVAGLRRWVASEAAAGGRETGLVAEQTE